MKFVSSARLGEKQPGAESQHQAIRHCYVPIKPFVNDLGTDPDFPIFLCYLLIANSTTEPGRRSHCLQTAGRKHGMRWLEGGGCSEDPSPPSLMG